MSLLSVNNLSVSYRTRQGVFPAVQNVSFDLEKGRSLGIVGESGCGKTTIGMSLLRLLPANGSIGAGSSILFDGRELTDLSAREMRSIRWKRISMIFQAAMNAWNPVQKIGDQIVEAIRIHNDVSRDDAVREVERLYELVDIPRDRIFHYPHEYSGGMKQRAIIAMALSCRPDLIVADEPTTALDVIVQDQILNKIKDIQLDLGVGIIFISHDIGIVADACHDILVMYRGKAVECGRREEVFVEPVHPYTRMLLSSYLTMDGVIEIREDETICAYRDMTEFPPEACGYIRNCPEADGICLTGVPRWRKITPTHKVLCHKCR